MSPRKIILFTAEFPHGEQETFLENEISYLSSAFAVQVLPLFGSEKKLRDYSNICEILPSVMKSRNIDLDLLIKSISKIMFWKVLFTGLLECRFSKEGIIKLLKQCVALSQLSSYLKNNPKVLKADLWYFYWGTNSVNILSFLKESPSSIARFHRFDLYDLDVEGGAVQFFRKKLLNRLKMVSVITTHGINYLKQSFDFDESKLRLHRLGVPDRGLSNSSEDGVLRIVTCSNIIEVKRLELLANSLLLIDNIKIEWTHFGSGSDEKIKNLKDLQRNFSTNISLNLKGRVNNSDLMQWYLTNKVDLFINVSLSEGLPVSIMEALSFGIPVYATDCGGVGELVGDFNGKLLDLDISSDNLARTIREFYKVYYNNKELRKNSKESWENLVSSELNYNNFCESLKEL